jgi:hypothetical protein
LCSCRSQTSHVTQQQRPRQQPNQPKRKHTGRNIALVIVGLLVLFGVIGALSGGNDTATNTPAASDDTPSATTAADGQPTKPTKPTKPTGTVLLSIKGLGTKTTKKFSAAKDWDLKWPYDCSGFGSQGNFIVSVNADHPLSEAATLNGVNQLGASDTGVEHYHAGGNGIWLEVNSECDSDDQGERGLMSEHEQAVPYAALAAAIGELLAARRRAGGAWSSDW